MLRIVLASPASACPAIACWHAVWSTFTPPRAPSARTSNGLRVGPSVVP